MPDLLRHPLLVYTASRLALLAVALLLLAAVGLRGPVLIVAAVLVSGAVSAFVLSRQRDALSGVVTSRVEAARARIDESARAEDEDDDRRRTGA